MLIDDKRFVAAVYDRRSSVFTDIGAHRAPLQVMHSIYSHLSLLGGPPSSKSAGVMVPRRDGLEFLVAHSAPHATGLGDTA
jgi:hypothetical protein